MKPVTHYSFLLGPESDDERRATLRRLADNGVTNVVLNSKLLEHFMVVPEAVMKFDSDMREFGVSFMDAHAPWGTWKDLAVPLEEKHEMVVLLQKMALRLCRHFGVTCIAYHTCNTLNSLFGSSLTIENYYDMMLRTIEALLPDAEHCGVVMALENQWTPLNQSAYLLKAVRHFDTEWLGICYDTGHGNLTEHGREFPDKTCVPPIWNDIGLPVVWEENFIEKVRPYIVNCHLHDNNGILDQHLLPGQGTVDWKRIMANLAAAPRLQCIQDEVNMVRENAPSIEESVKTFDRLTAMM